jgi:hypothetical protein
MPGKHPLENRMRSTCMQGIPPTTCRGTHGAAFFYYFFRAVSVPRAQIKGPLRKSCAEVHDALSSRLPMFVCSRLHVFNFSRHIGTGVRLVDRNSGIRFFCQAIPDCGFMEPSTYLQGPGAQRLQAASTIRSRRVFAMISLKSARRHLLRHPTCRCSNGRYASCLIGLASSKKMCFQALEASAAAKNVRDEM